MAATTTSADAPDTLACEVDGCDQPARRCGCGAGHCDQHPHPDAVVEAEGYTVTITRSVGTDGAVVIFIDGPDDGHGERNDHSPGCRVRLNDDPLYVGVEYHPHD